MKSLVCPLFLAWLLSGPGHTAFAADANHDYSRWEKEIAAFERADATNPPPKGACLFIGSSTIRKWTALARDLPGQRVINRGFGGSEIVDATHFADRIIYPYAPRLVFLRAGGNDLWAGKSVDEVFTDFQAFAATVHARLPDAGIVYISLSPSLARWKQRNQEKAVNDLVHAFIQGRPWLHYIETYAIPLGPDGRARSELFEPDGLHFNAAGYQLLTQQVLAQWPAASGQK